MLNLRGVKRVGADSVADLLAIYRHAYRRDPSACAAFGQYANPGSNSYQETGDVKGLGLFVTLAILLHAYSLGGGTYTGIEAVSNGLQILREPRVVTGKKTMLYMATSLAFTASGILLCYLLNRVKHEPGKTLNASLFAGIYRRLFWRRIVDNCVSGHRDLDHRSRAAGRRGASRFPRGPRVLSNMSLDSWAPHVCRT